MEYVNVQQREYEELQNTVAQIHENFVLQEAALQKSIKELTAVDGGLYVKEVSNKVDMLLQTLTREPMQHFLNAFSDTEAAIALFLERIIEEDKIQ